MDQIAQRLINQYTKAIQLNTLSFPDSLFTLPNFWLKRPYIGLFIRYSALCVSFRTAAAAKEERE